MQVIMQLDNVGIASFCLLGQNAQICNEN